MNRPPKKKNQKKNDLLKDPRFDMEELEEAGDARTPQDGDDRNVVEVGDAFKEAEFEDKVWLIWERNKSAIVAGVVAAFIAVLVVQGFKWTKQIRTTSMQDAFSAVSTDEERLQFAEDYAGKGLAGFALLQVADAKYKEEAFSEAAVLYTQAAESLGEDSTLSGRTQLGTAMSTLLSGEEEAGKSQLSSIANSDTALESTRSQALFHLAILAIRDKNFEEAKSLISRIENLTETTVWGQQAAGLRFRYPELAKEEEKTEEETAG